MIQSNTNVNTSDSIIYIMSFIHTKIEIIIVIKSWKLTCQPELLIEAVVVKSCPSAFGFQRFVIIAASFIGFKRHTRLHQSDEARCLRNGEAQKHLDTT